MRLESAPHDRPKGANNSVAPFDAKTISVGEHVSRTINAKMRICALRDIKLDVTRFLEVARKRAIDVPLMRREHPVLHLHFLGGASVVTNNARHEDFSELSGDRLKARADKINKVLN